MSDELDRTRRELEEVRKVLITTTSALQILLTAWQDLVRLINEHDAKIIKTTQSPQQQHNNTPGGL